MKLEVKSLNKSFGDKQVLKDVCFSVESGNALGLLGRNGAGKTTAIRIIMGVFTASGEILIDGKHIERSKIKFGYLPEEHGMYPKKKILEQLIYFGCLKGMNSKDARASASALLRRVEMDNYANAKLDTLSKGNQQKIQLVCALLDNPDIIILDEPFSGLDPVNAMLLKDVVSDLINDGKIVIFSSHQMNYIEEFCENIAIINKGEISIQGKLSEIKRSYERNKLVISSKNIHDFEDAVDRDYSDYIISSKIIGEKLTLTLKDENKKSELTSKLALLGIDFDSISVYEPTLNDIFVQYTEE